MWHIGLQKKAVCYSEFLTRGAWDLQAKMLVYCRYRKQSLTSEKHFLSDEGHTLETLDFTLHIGSTPTFLYFDLYLNIAYTAYYIY